MGEQRLREMLRARPLPNLRLLPFQPMEHYPDILGSADVLVALLEPTAGTFSVPSKVLSYLCAGRPVLAAIPPENLAARTIERAGAGLVVSPTDEEAFLVAAKRLRVEHGLRHDAGRAARAYAEVTFDTDRITDRFETVIDRAVARRATVTSPPQGDLTAMDHVLVTGAGGFIGGHLVVACARTASVASAPSTASRNDEWYQVFDDVENVHADLPAARRQPGRHRRCRHRVQPGGRHGRHGLHREQQGRCACCRCSIITHVLVAARDAGRRAPASTPRRRACTRPRSRRRPRSSRCARPTPTRPCPRTATAGRSSSASAWPATSSRTSASRPGSPATTTSTAPHGTWDGGREKAPAAICRKVATAALTGDHTIEIWGDGEQTRSFTYIDDCLEGTLRLTASDVSEPLNIGSDQLVTINQLVDIVEGIAGVTLERRYKLDAPQGVRGRNSDNTLIRERLGWAPSITLEDGLAATYAWVHDQVAANLARS